MSSNRILHKAVFEEGPALIDNAYFVPEVVEQGPSPTDALVEALQHEHPDVEPDEIEDTLQEVLDQLRDATPEGGAVDGELEGPELNLDFLDAEEGARELEDALPDVEAPPPAAAVAEDTGAAAAELLENARREAQQILAEADDRAAEIERAAYEKGYEEGIAAGKTDGTAQAKQMLEQMVAIVDQATELHDTMLAEAESEMVALCLEIARKIIQSELRTNPDVVKSVLSAAVKKINGSPRVTIKVNPSQLESVREHWDAAFGPDYREKEWAIEPDPNVAAGGCVLDTKYGSLDARIGTQLGEIQKTFALLLGTGQ